MKVALITEEQIDKIKDGISMIASSQEHADAMEVLRSLKTQEPVAYTGSAGLGYDKNKYLSIPLYALEQL